MQKLINVFFLDNLGEGITPAAIAKAFSREGRYVRVLYADNLVLDEVGILRPLFELNTLKNLAKEVAFERNPQYSEYLYIAYNCSVPYLLFKEPDRVAAGNMYRKIIRSFSIGIPVLAFNYAVGSESSPIGRAEFIHNLTNGKFYTKHFRDLDAVVSSCGNPAELLSGVVVSDAPACAEIQEISCTNLTKI